MMRSNDSYAPTVRGPKLRWTRPTGLVYLLIRSLWRYFVTGKELAGRGDNATFLRDATEDYRHRPEEKLTRARWRRVTRRWVILGVPLVLLAVWVAAGVRLHSGSADLW